MVFTGGSVTVSLLKSPSLFSIFRLSSIMLSFGWSPLVRQLLNPTGPLIILQSLCQKHQSQLVPPTLSCSIVSSILQFSSKVEVLILLYTFFLFYSVVSWGSKVDNFGNFLFFIDDYKVGLLAEIRWSVCMFKSHSSLCVSFSWKGAGLCIYNWFVWSN